MGYRINPKKFGIAFLIGIVAIFMFLLAMAPQYRGTGVTIEDFDRLFYVLFAFIIGISILVGLEKE